MGMEKNTTFMVVYFDPSKRDTYDSLIEAKAQKVGATRNGSGTGFGRRDISFDVPDEKVGQFKRDCEKLKYVYRVFVCWK